VYSAPTPVESSGQILANLREQMEPEGKARFDRQLEAEYQKLIVIGRGHLELQASPIGLPDLAPMRQYRKRKNHGLADARGLTGTEIAALELKNRGALVRKRDIATPEDSEEDDGLLLFGTPQGLLESPKVVHLSHYPIGLARNTLGIYLSDLKLLGLKLLRLLLSLDCSLRNLPFLQHLQQPPRLEGGGRGKRKRAHTERVQGGCCPGRSRRITAWKDR
jgi:hypothetical protein